MNTQRLSALPVQVDLTGLPAAWLRELLLALSSPEAAEVFDAQLADLHAEWLAARKRSWLHAAWIGLGIRAHLLTCAAYYACVWLGLPALRTAGMIGIASCITFALFFGIATLIAQKPVETIPTHKMPPLGMPDLAPPSPPRPTVFPVRPPPPVKHDTGPAISAPPAPTGPGDDGGEPVPTTGGAQMLVQVGPIEGPSPNNLVCLPMVRNEPVYPESAIRRRIEGQVVVDVAIDPNGSVSHAAVLQSDPAGVFDDAVLRAVRRWRYRVSGDANDAGCDHAQVRLLFQLPRTH